MLPANWNWKSPDYSAAFQQRMDALQRIRAHPEMLPDLKAYYRENIADFINDWGTTYDPRLVERGLPALIPFLLFERQREFVEYVIRKWREGRRGLGEKARDEGVSWLAVGTSCGLCTLYDGIGVGLGSRKEEYVDRIGDPKSLFQKGRIFMQNLPVEFRAGWSLVNAPFMRMNFPETGSNWTGEVGDNMGRGDRTSLYWVDEAAHLERAELIEASLSQTTNCRIDISSVNGMNNVFAKNRHSGKIEVFVFRWEEDPRKDKAWYDAQCEDLDPVVVAQEIDRDYTASVEGIVIPGAWVRAAVDALPKLGLVPSGEIVAALDVADEGVDANAWGKRKGVEVLAIEEWGGKGSDIFATLEKAFGLCDEHGCHGMRYDADGLGAGARGDARVINERRAGQNLRVIGMTAFRGSGEVIEPDAATYQGGSAEQGIARTNRDLFQNAKSQNWWYLREKFRKTWRWVVHGKACPPDEIVSLNSAEIGPLLPKLVTELSQPTFSLNGAGKILIDKKPDGLKSPNLSDCCMMMFAKMGAEPLNITPAVLAQVRQFGQRRRLR
jgi:phage terminase large subunit